MSKQSNALRDEQTAQSDEMWGRIGAGVIAVAAVIELVRGAVVALL